MFRRLYVKLFRLWYRLVILKSSPHKVALGFAVGVFIAYTPTFGIQIILALGVAALLRVNPIAAVIGTYVTNFFTSVPLYAMCYEVGRLIVGGKHLVGIRIPEVRSVAQFIHQVGKLTLEWMAIETVGAVIVGIVTGVPAYFLVLFGLKRWRAARLNRRLQRMNDRLKQAGGPAAQ
jgi:hypothetical protein